MAYPTWLTPYEAGKFIEGVLKGNDIKRPLLFQQQFGNVNTTWRDTVNLDVEFDKRNVMGTFAEPQADLNPIQLPNFGTLEFSFAYAKEAVGSPDYSELSQRMLGQQQDSVSLTNLASQYSANIAEKTRLAYQRIENLKEWVATQILITGKCTAQSQYHHTVKWDFQRPVYTVPTALATTPTLQTSNYTDFRNTQLISEVNLTTAQMNGTAGSYVGGASWDNADGSIASPVARTGGVTTSIDPVADLNRMLETANYRAGTEMVVMSSDAYSWFNAAIQARYSAAFDTTMRNNIALTNELLPWVKTIEGLVLRRMWDTGSGSVVPIYTYEGVYHDRVTGARTRYMPNGYVLLVPSRAYGLQRYGKILHQKAGWQAMPTWVNYWQNEKTGVEEWELHTNFVFAHTDMRSVVCWKVCSTAAGV